MENFSCYTSKTDHVLSKRSFLSSAFLLVALLLSNQVFAQVNLPSSDRCTSKDLELVSASLSGSTGCVDCIDGELLDPQSLILSIDNKTGSTRTSFAFWGTLEVYNSDGTPDERVSISGCNGPIKSNDRTTLPFEVIETSTNSNYVQNGQIIIKCGQTLKLTNLFLAWTDASNTPKNQCPLDPSKIAPKCGTLPSIDVSTGLNASGIVTEISCAGNDGAIDITVTGGAAPYTYDWSDLPGTNDPADRSNLGPGMYHLTVKDAAGCEDEYQVTLEAPDPVNQPYVIVHDGVASLCGTPTAPSLEICSPESGVTYVLTQTGVQGTRELTDTGNGVVFQNLVAGAGFSVKAKKGECESAATECGDGTYVVEQCPAMGSAIKAQSSSSIRKADTSKNNELTAYPVPFSNKATVEFKMAASERYEINLYDMKGTLIKQLKSGKAKAGELQQVEVDGQQLTEGMYLVRMVSSKGSQTVKILKKE